ncbi:MAG: nuclear transport factor 2 family protein [bacterium]
MKFFKTYSLLFLLALGTNSVLAQQATFDELEATLKSADSLLFDRAFNHCEQYHLKTLIAEDFEFYHDQGGISQSKAEFLKIMSDGICRKDNPVKSRRELVEGSLKVFPLYREGQLYGALQTGEHRFFESYNGAPETKGSIALFSHLWLLKDNQWQVARVISYNHKSQL